MSPEPFVSRAKAPPAKRSEKGYGDENGLAVVGVHGFYLMAMAINVLTLQNR